MNWLDRKLYRKPWWRKLRGLPEPTKPIFLSYVMKEALRILENSLTFDLKASANRDYEDAFKAGGTIKIRRPTRFIMKDEQNASQTDT